MKKACVFALSVFVFTLGMFGQSDVPTFKAEVKSAFVWGEDSPAGAVSSTIQDPLTGTAMPKLSYAGIEVISRMGFEGVGMGEAGHFLGYTATIVNGSDSRISVRYGGIRVDGHAAPLLFVVPADKALSKKELKRMRDVVELRKMYCFASGFLSSENFFSMDSSSKALTVEPGTAVTVSSVIRDPRSHSVQCSTEGCHPLGTIRYYLRVNSQDYVFVWPGRFIVYCGK